MLPSHQTKPVNDESRIDVLIYGNGLPVVRHGRQAMTKLLRQIG